MTERFKKSNYVDIVRSLVPSLGEDGGSFEVHSDRLPHLRHVILFGKEKHRGMINFDELYRNHGSSESA